MDAATSGRFKRGTPESAGVSSRAFVNFLAAARDEGHELHSFMAVKDGVVLCERFWAPYTPNGRQEMYSLSKSFTSVAVGMAVDEGLLTVDTRVVDIFKDEMARLDGRVDEKLPRMTIRHLLTMTTGQTYENWDWGENNILGFLSAHIAHEPGTAFFYNTLATYMLSAAITRLTGQKLVDWLRPRLFDPLGVDPYWREDMGAGVSTGGFGLNIRTEDIAAFGQFLLQKGMWNGKRLVSESWVDEATRKQVENAEHPSGLDDWQQGYGYQFWRCCPEGVYRGDGMFGQYVVVEQATRTVLALTSNTDMARMAKLLWQLLADMKAAPMDDAAEADLAAFTNLSLLSAGENAEAYPAFRGEYVLTERPGAGGAFDSEGLSLYSLHVDFADDACVLMLFDDRRRPAYGTALFRNRAWTYGAASWPEPMTRYGRCVTYGEWRGNVFTATIWHYELPQRVVMRLTFDDARASVLIETKTGAFDAAFTPPIQATRR